MKKYRRFFFVLGIVGVCSLTFSCKEEPKFDIDLIVGKWVSGTEYWRYDTDGTGVTWDEADDVHEDEAQAFKWEFDPESNRLNHIHWMEMTQEWTLPKSYTLKSLDDNKLSYKDRFDSTYTFNRVL